MKTIDPPDKVNEVALARAPVPLKARPLSGPVIVIIGLPLFPEKVMVPVVGADNVTDEFAALADSEPNATPRIKTTEITRTFRILEALPGRVAEDGLVCSETAPALNAQKPSIHKIIVNSTAVLEPNLLLIRLSQRPF
ncbi:MAG: hypothetical protein WA735_05120 [Candidatus Acidiferrales bacterium]